MLDASTVFELNAFVNRAIMKYQPVNNTIPSSKLDDFTFEELPLLLNEAIEREIRRISIDFVKNTESIEHEFFVMDNIGEAMMRSLKCPPKSAFQIVAMMASFAHFGRLEPCWETVSLSNFLKGRVAITQGVLPPVALFLQTANDQNVSKEHKRKLFFEAARVHANLITKENRGLGHDRYLSALQQVIQPEDGFVAFFDDYAYSRTRPRKFMSHTHETGMLELGFQLRDPDAIWEHYVVEEKW